MNMEPFSKITPITPTEAGKRRQTCIPDEVIEAFNDLIASNFEHGSSHVKQKDIVAFLVKRGLTEKDIYDNNWLDVKSIYRKAGWKVKYDKPGYCENYDAFYEFTKK